MGKLRNLKERVEEFLHRMGLDAKGEGIYLFRRGTTAVTVSLLADERHSYVRVVATLLTGIDQPGLELLRRINRLNGEVQFGAFILFDDGNLCFAATILGDRLDYEELESVLSYVSGVGDVYDEQLQEIAGGMRVKDVLDAEEQVD